MLYTLHDERRKQRLLTQCEVAAFAGCSVGRLQNHTRHGLIELPKQQLGSKFYYTESQAKEIKNYFESRTLWQRLKGRNVENE